MATRYAVASGDWSDSSNVWSDSDGGAAGSYVPINGDTFVILAGVNVKMDVDQSVMGTGMAGTNIIRGGATPGMLYFCDGDSGYLKLSGDLTGTTDTNRGRLLANSDGSWGTNTGMSNTYKAVIALHGGAQIESTNLDHKLIDTEPTNKFVHCYGTKYDFDAETDCNPTTNVLTLNTTAPAAGTDVVLVAAAGATLPTGLYEDMLYYVRANSGNDCKLATTNSDDTIVDITADGSGTIYLLTEQASSTSELNVLEDVTSDAPWSAAAGHNFVVLVDALASGNYDIQRMTISVIDDADTITLDASVDSAQYAGTRLYLSSRNVSVRYYSMTNQGIFNYGSGDTHGGIFQCEIRNAQSQTSFYGYGIMYGSGHTVSGIVSGCNNGTYYGSGHTISGTISGCSSGINNGSGHTLSGTMSGCNYGINNGSGYTISGPISGCSSGIYYGSGHTLSGTMSGCNYGINYGSGHTISGTISGCSSGINNGSGHTISGTISGCSSGIYYGTGCTISGTISGCSYGINNGSGHTLSGTISGCSYSFRFPFGNIIIMPGANVTYSFYNRGSIVGEDGRISIEEFEGTPNSYKVIDQYGDIIKVACDGTSYPTQDPDGGNGYCLEASSIQEILDDSTAAKLILFGRKDVRMWVAAGSYTVTFKVLTTYAGIAEGGLTLRCWYIGTGGAIIETTDDSAISQASGNTDWTQSLAVSFTSTAAGWVDFQMELTEYESGNEVYIWPTPVIS